MRGIKAKGKTMSLWKDLYNYEVKPCKGHYVTTDHELVEADKNGTAKPRKSRLLGKMAAYIEWYGDNRCSVATPKTYRKNLTLEDKAELL